MYLNSNQISKIDKSIDIGDGKKIVMLDVMGDQSIAIAEFSSNIYCIDCNNCILWQVKRIEPQLSYGTDCFVHLTRNNNGEIIAYRFSGFTYEINPDTGEATCTGFHK